MSMKMRFSSSSLAFSWLKRSSHSVCHWVKASAMAETLRSSGWCWKSNEISNESQSFLDSLTQFFPISIASVFTAFSWSGNGIEQISCNWKFNVGAKNERKNCATFVFRTLSTISVSFLFSCNTAVSWYICLLSRYRKLGDAELIFPHVTPDISQNSSRIIRPAWLVL